MSEEKKNDRVEEEAQVPPETDVQPEAETPADENGNDWREKYLRSLAELDNFRKRMERDRELSQRYALEDLVRALLPVLDHLELACASEGGAEAIREGVALALKDALRVLGERGVEPIEAVDRPFDPHLHEAMAGVPDAEHEPGTCLVELCRGYTLHGRVLRPTKVHVAVEPPKTAADQPAEDAPSSRD
ncbi:MAG: nucleotide exchange factor GrpE [Planctomycetota bacterium]|jgi:molecular chaperone GrpE